jgi:exopolyphosphatase/guanosine-5'-triphosphate,3'-diphosphate pyrophosphatase
MAKLGIIDIGTNSIHMILAEVESDFSYKILDRFKDMTRLGDGAFRQRRLQESAMTRGLEVIRTLVTLARNKGYERIEAIATSAVREAKNGGEFVDAVARQTGLTVRVVSGDEEARLIYLGVRHSMELADQPSLILDVGGGSVELIVGDRKKMIQGQSLKLGAIRLKDLHLKHDPPSKSMLRDLERTIESQVKAALKPFRGWQFDRLIGTSGMIGNLAEMIHVMRTGRPLQQLNLATVSLKEVCVAEAMLAKATFKERLALPGLDPKRADTLLPAAKVIRTVMERTGQERLTLSDKAIRDGLVYDFIERNREGIRTEREIPNVRRRHVIYLARRCHYPKAHSHHVAKLALRLFEQTRALHGLGDREQEWLEYAALLHDVGYLINSRQHHKHAYYLIKNADLYGLTAEEIELIANVARYHRRALPDRRHASLLALAPKRRKTVEMLSALLRIADALDRTQFGVIQDVTVRLGKPLTIGLSASGDAELELWAARNRADLFEKIFKRSVHFLLHPRQGQGDVA